MLARSEQLDEATLIENARSKSQDHLLAISQRRVLAEAVTDVLVDRGNSQVALSTARNPGAKFSDFGYTKLGRKVEQAGLDKNIGLDVLKIPGTNGADAGGSDPAAPGVGEA